MGLCEYKNILGAPGTGVHSIRLFNIAVFDVLLTFVLAWGINALIGGNFKTYFIVLIFSFCLGIALHDLFCVNTTIGNYLKK
jgi:hypothetical protein